MLILSLNSGSSSIKYRLTDMPGGQLLAAGLLEGIGEPQGCLTQAGSNRQPLAVTDHRQGLALIFEGLAGLLKSRADALAIGHRVVHGGCAFNQAALINAAVEAQIEALQELAPLHNPPNLLGIRACRALWPQVPQVAVFDTAFHQSLPPHAYHYALPLPLAENLGLRRYGFHGISVQSALKQAAACLGKAPQQLNLIVLHLGNGASVTAIEAGRSVDTSMGMTPLAGLMMGSRCGDLDPGLLLHLLQHGGLDAEGLNELLTRQSGFKGLCGDNDLRHILARAGQGDAAAQLALDMYAHQLKKYIGAYCALLGRVDALIFTGGIGENAGEIRAAALRGLEPLGLKLDPQQNAADAAGIRPIHAPPSRTAIWVIPADEEREIAEQTYQRIFARQDS
jgi:acetate kinase